MVSLRFFSVFYENIAEAFTNKITQNSGTKGEYIDELSCLTEIKKILTLIWRGSQSYRSQFIDLQSKSMDWFLYNRDIRHERVKKIFWGQVYERNWFTFGSPSVPKTRQV